MIIRDDGIVIRLASSDDVENLADLGGKTFTEKFGHLYPPEDLQYYLNTQQTAKRYADFVSDPRFRVWIAENHSQPVAYILVGPCELPHPAVTPECGEIWRLYVRNEFQNKRVGHDLMLMALEWLSSPGRRLWVGVWSENFGAQRFYDRYGFKRVGDYFFPVGSINDFEFILSNQQ